MQVWFVPIKQTQNTKYGEGSQVGQWVQDDTRFSYDTFGNQTIKKELGDALHSGDERVSVMSYAVISTTAAYNGYIVGGKTGSTALYSGDDENTGTLYAYTQNYFDNQTTPGVIGSGSNARGLATKAEQVGVDISTGMTSTQTISGTFLYDAYGNQTQVKDPNGNPTTTSYDGFYHAFPVSVMHPNSRSEYAQYDFTLDAASVMTDMNGTVSEQLFDSFGRPLVGWTDGYGSPAAPNVSYGFDDTNLAAVTPPFYISITMKLADAIPGSPAKYSYQMRWYDGEGRVLEDVTPKDPAASPPIIIITDNTYDERGKQASVSMPYTEPQSNPFSYTQPITTSPRTSTAYDLLGRNRQVTNPDGSRLSYTYDLLQWVGVLDETATQLKWQHTDMLGRTDVSEQTQYNAHPPSTAQSMLIDTYYDVLDRPTEVSRDYLPHPLLEYTPVNTFLSYDLFGRKSVMDDPDMGEWRYGYDGAGNVVSQTDAIYLADPQSHADHQLFFSYDTMNREKATFYGASHYTANTPDVVYYYDNDLGDAATAYSWGKVRQVNRVDYSANHTASNGHGYLYDPRGLPLQDVVTTTQSTHPYTVSYAYDAGQRMTGVTYPNAGTPETVSVYYNSQGMGLPNQLSSNQSTGYPVYSALYNQRGQLSTLQQASSGAGGDLLNTQYTYSVRGWLTNTQVTTQNGSNVLLNLTNTYSANGNVSQVQNQGISNVSATNPTYTNSYVYDSFFRMVSATSTSSLGTGVGIFPGETYQFDALSRITSRTVGSGSNTYTYATGVGTGSHLDAPLSYAGTTYTYDADGNQTGSSNTSTSTTQSRSFDQENRLVEVVQSVGSGPGATTTTSDYVYDSNGKRLVQKVTHTGVGTSTNSTLYIGNLYEEDITTPGATNPAYTVYYFLADKMVGLRKANYGGGTDGTYRMVGDYLGSTTLVVDTSNPPNVVHREYYSPYGQVAQSFGTQKTSVGYTGQRLDTDTGLMYYGARYYDPVLAYFVSADSTTPDKHNPLDYNKYLYTRGNPLRFVDTIGYGPDDQYVVATGCVFNLSCSDNSHLDASDMSNGYIQLLKELFDKGGWGFQQASDGTQRYESFGAWAFTHVHMVHVSSLDDGAARINSILTNDIPKGDFNIHMFGTSQGGAAILQYFADTLPGTGAHGHGSQYQLDPRIASFITVDSPLNQVTAYIDGVTGHTTDDFDIGGYLAANTRIKTVSSNVGQGNETALNIDGADFVNHLPLMNVRKKPDPDFSGFAPIPHIQHTHDVAPNTRDFFLRVWK